MAGRPVTCRRNCRTAGKRGELSLYSRVVNQRDKSFLFWKKPRKKHRSISTTRGATRPFNEAVRLERRAGRYAFGAPLPPRCRRGFGDVIAGGYWSADNCSESKWLYNIIFVCTFRNPNNRIKTVRDESRVALCDHRRARIVQSNYMTRTHRVFVLLLCF